MDYQVDTFIGRPVEILLIEDNLGDIRLTQEALTDAKVTNHLHVVRDGIEAMAFLRKTDNFQQSPTPDLVFLDLNLPKKDGREVLAEMKEEEVLKRIPVVVLTTSKAEEDIVRSYDSHANCYVTKPVDMVQFINVIRSVNDFWLTIVKLPS